MNKQVITTVAVVTVVVVSAFAAKAQTNSNARLVANIPFEFNVGNRILPAGTYDVECVTHSTDLKVLRLRSRDGHMNAVVQTSVVKGKTGTREVLVFHRYGDRYFFAQAWLTGEETGYAAVRSNTEKQVARELVRTNTKMQTVAIHRLR